MKSILSKNLLAKLFLGLTLCLLVSTDVFANNKLAPKTHINSPAYVANELLVKVKAGGSIEFANAFSGGKTIHRDQHTGIQKVRLPIGSSLSSAVSLYSQNQAVEYVEPNYIYRDEWVSNDPFLNDQWGLNQARIYQAWDISTGSSSVAVAIIDTGIDYTHPDLKDKIVNPYNAMTGAVTLSSVIDNDGHGTHVAGIAAASINNSYGIAGTGGNVRIMPIKASEDGNFAADDVADAIYRAADSGAKVINMSLGGSSNSATVLNAVNYALGKNVVLVAAAGNEGTNTLTYPAAFNGVIAVGASDPTDNKATFSNYGTFVDVVAPGVDIVSTFPTYTVPTTDITEWAQGSGTSQASPMVAGLAGLALSANPSLTPSQVTKAICYGANDLGTTGPDDFFGWGRINGYNTMVFATDATRPTVVTTLPTNNGTQVSINTQPTITFSERIDTQSLAYPTPTLKDSQNNSIPCSFTLGGNQLTLNPINPLTDGTTYTVDLPNGAVKDIIGNLSMPYTFSFTTTMDDHGDSIGTATSIQVGSTVQGNIETVGDLDFFRFTAGTSGTYTIKSIGTTDTYGSLLDSSGMELAANDDGAGNSQFQITANLVASHTYYVKVNLNSSGTGAYSLLVTAPPVDDHGNTLDTATSIQVGSIAEGNIEIAGDVDLFRFTAGATGNYTIKSTGTTDTYGYLLNSSGTQLAADDDGAGNSQFQIVANLTAGQTYYVKVRHHGSGTGAYSLLVTAPPVIVDDYGNTLDTAASIQVGSTVQGNIEIAGDVDLFKFTAGTTGNYTIKSMGTTDTYGYLLNSSGTQLAADDDGAGSSQFQIVANLTAGQTYYVKVRHHGTGTGAYSVLVTAPPADDHGNTFQTATPFQVGTATQGNIEVSGDVDMYRFTAATSGNYTIKSLGTTDTYGYLYNSSGTQLAADDDGAGSSQFQIMANLTGGQTYYVKVKHHGTGTGAYSLLVTAPPVIVDDHSNTFDTATPIQVGSTVQGNIEISGDVDIFKFTAGTSGNYTIKSMGSIDTHGFLYNSSGTQLATDDDGAGSSQFQIVANLTVGQTYYVKVKHHSTGTGAYSLLVTAPPVVVDDHGNTFDTATSIQVDSLVQGKIEITGDVDLFKFTAGASGNYTIKSIGSIDTHGYLFNSSGTQLATDDDGAGSSQFQIVANLTVGQTYYVKVKHHSTGTGDYSLLVTAPPVDDHGNTFDAATSIQVGSTVQGNIEVAGDVDMFKFTAGTSGSYTIKSLGTIDTYGYLYNASGTQLAVDDDSAGGSQFQIVANLTGGQTYYVKAKHHGTGTGSYSLSVTAPPADDHGNSLTTATNIQVGTAVQGNIETAGDVDLFSFTVGTSGSYTLKSIGTTDTYGYLLNSSGTQLAANDDGAGGSQFLITANLTAGQTYYVKVKHYNASGTGTYSVLVTRN